MAAVLGCDSRVRKGRLAGPLARERLFLAARPRRSGLGVVWSEYLLLDCQCALEERLGLGVAALQPVQFGQVVEARNRLTIRTYIHTPNGGCVRLWRYA